MQPIKFKPILKETIWGGCKIPRIKHISGLEDKHIGKSPDLMTTKVLLMAVLMTESLCRSLLTR